jgi:hypothetical protein
VLGGGRERNIERLGELTDGAFAASQITQHLTPGGVAERVKNRIQPGVI